MNKRELKLKKQTYWKAIRAKDKSMTFEEAQGYVIDLTDNYGYTIKIALEYKRPYWYATDYDSGLATMPYRDIKEYPQRSNVYKSKEELIDQLKQIDFEKYIKGNTFLENLKRQLDEYKTKN